MPYELAIVRGTVVSPGGRRRANVYVDEGRIVAVTDQALAATKEINAEGLHVLPGAIDPHVHFFDPVAHPVASDLD